MIFTPFISRYDGDGASNDDEWSGAARIHDGHISGSGVLLASGLHLLSVAHLLDDLVLANSSVVFETASGLAEVFGEVDADPFGREKWGENKKG